MIRLREKFKEHDDHVEGLLKNVYEFKNEKAPYVIYDAAPYYFGELPESIPAGYLDDPGIMMNYQINCIQRHYDEIPDDCFAGFLYPWFGTCVLASAFGVPVEYNKNMDPTVANHIINDPDEIKKMKLPDPYKDGLMPKVLKFIEYFKENCDLPISVTNCQGPLTTAISIIGLENYIYWSVDYPEVIHELMDKVSEALIQWVKLQKRTIGVSDEHPGYILSIKIPEGFGGIWMSDDNSVILDSNTYKEFVVPYHSRILKAFGGGGLHFCGNATHQMHNYINTDGLRVVHNYTLDDIENAIKTKKALSSKKIAYILGDFTPRDERLVAYFNEIFSQVDQKGLMVVSCITPAMGLNKGKYEIVARDKSDLTMRVKKIIQRLDQRS